MKYRIEANPASSANLAGFSQSMNNPSVPPPLLPAQKIREKTPARQEKMRTRDGGMHNICCTRLWTACTRLIFQEIKGLLFY